MALQYVTWMSKIHVYTSYIAIILQLLGHNGMGWKWQRRFIHIWSGGEKFENFWNSLWQPDFLEGGCQVPSQTRLRLDMQSSPGMKNKLRIFRKSILTLMSTRLLRMVTSSLRSDNWSPCSLHPTTVASSTMLVSQSPPCPTTMWQCFHEFDSFRSRPCFFSCSHKHGWPSRSLLREVVFEILF